MGVVFQAERVCVHGPDEVQGRQSDPPSGALCALLLPPLTHIVDRENNQTCRQRRWG